MFFIFESVILFFSKHSNFRGILEVIYEEFKQIRQSKSSEDYWALGR